MQRIDWLDRKVRDFQIAFEKSIKQNAPANQPKKSMAIRKRRATMVNVSRRSAPKKPKVTPTVKLEPECKVRIQPKRRASIAGHSKMIKMLNGSDTDDAHPSKKPKTELKWAHPVKKELQPPKLPIDIRLEQTPIVLGLYHIDDLLLMRDRLRKNKSNNTSFGSLSRLPMGSPITPAKDGFSRSFLSQSPISLASDISTQAPILLRARDPLNDMEIQQIVDNYVEDESETYEDEYHSDSYTDCSDDNDNDNHAAYEVPNYLVSPIRTQFDAGHQSSISREVSVMETGFAGPPTNVAEPALMAMLSKNTQRTSTPKTMVFERRVDDHPTHANQMDFARSHEQPSAEHSGSHVDTLDPLDIDSPEYEEHVPRSQQEQDQQQNIRQHKHNRSLSRRKSKERDIVLFEVSVPIEESDERVTCSEEDLIKTSNANTNHTPAVCDPMITSTIITGHTPDRDRLLDEYEFAKQNGKPQIIVERRKTYVSDPFHRASPS